jgi:ABC-type lipoprotein release transport system permease subunit
MHTRKILASMKIALRALRVNKMRSALTMLGIIIGVAAVIAMVAVGSGAQERIKEQIASIGSNLIVVLSGQHHQLRHPHGHRQCADPHRRRCACDHARMRCRRLCRARRSRRRANRLRQQ